MGGRDASVQPPMNRSLSLLTLFALCAVGVLVAVSRLDVGAQLLGLGVALALGAGVALYVWRTPALDALTPRAIILLGLALRLLSLLAMPILEDDHFRYLWDGYRYATAGTPYGPAPAAFFDDATVPPAFQHILDSINYPDIPTIYGPLMELMFLAGYALAPAQVWALQLFNAVGDTVLLLLLARTGARPRALLLYAVSPLVLMESVMTAHPDALVGLLGLAGLVGARRPWLRGVLLGLAAAFKAPVLILLPFLLRRGGARALGGFALALMACYLPVLLRAGSDLPALGLFARQWHFNPLLFAAIEALAGGGLARPLAGLFLAALLLLIYRQDWRAPAPVPAADLALGALLVLAPVVNPWYVLWLLPFAVLRPSRCALGATFVLPLSYWNSSQGAHLGGGQFDLPLAVTVYEVLVLAGLAGLDAWRPLFASRRRAGHSLSLPCME